MPVLGKPVVDILASSERVMDGFKLFADLVGSVPDKYALECAKYLAHP